MALAFRVRFHEGWDTLPQGAETLFRNAENQDFFLSATWFRLLAETTPETGGTPLVLTVETDAEPAQVMACLPARLHDRDPQFAGGRSLVGLTTFYTMRFGPLFAEGVDAYAACTALATALRDRRPAIDGVRFDVMDPASPDFQALADALSDTGFVVEPYFQFGNWFVPTAGVSAEDYLAGRPSALRNTLRRRGRKLSDIGGRFVLIAGRDGLEDGIAAYQQVYDASWKEPERHPRFMPALIRQAAALGLLRLGLAFVGDEPAAAQVWLVHGGRATIYKLAHDERFKELSIGSLLTRHLVEAVLDTDHVTEIDYGSGDDPYKQQWMTERRERWGLVADNPRTWRGRVRGLRRVATRWGKCIVRRQP